MNKKKNLETVVQDTKTVVTHDGVLLDVEQHKTFPVGEEPAYYKVYMQDVSAVLGLEPAEQVVFKACCANMTFGNRIFLIKRTKMYLEQLTGYKFNTIRATITKLVKKGLLLREDTSTYIVNPKFAARGKWEDIRALRLVIEYSEQGRNIEVKKITNKVIEIEEHRPKQLELFEELPLDAGNDVDKEQDLWDAANFVGNIVADDLSFPDEDPPGEPDPMTPEEVEWVQEQLKKKRLAAGIGEDGHPYR